MSENLNQVDVTIQIAGSTCDYETLTPHQSMHGHHSFEILVNYKPNKPSLWSITPETVFEQLGVAVDIKMEHLMTGELTEFAGVVTNIQVGGRDGDQGYARLFGGNPKREDTTRAAFDMELQQLRIRSKLEQLNTELYDYDPNTDDYKEDAAPESIEGVNSYMRVAKDRASNFYKEPAKLPAGRAMIDESDIMATTRAHFSRVYSQSSVFEAVSNTCAIRVGELITTRLPESLQKDCGPDLGRYRVLSITHIVDQKGLYRNKFRGVAGATETLPLPEGFKAPMAFPEPATVTDNADPDKLGRVQVRFFWQDQDAASNWMRVQTPGAGTSEVIEKNRGFWFVPEIGDQVMVAFEQGDPSRPFVAGSLFHMNNTSGMAPDNNIKAITTRSGHTIEFEDTDGAEKIHIRDNGGSVITFDTQEKSLLLSSVENIALSAKNISLNAEENITLGAQQNVELAAEADVSAVAKGNVALQSDGDSSVAAKGAVNIEAKQDLAINGMNAAVEGKQKADLKGMQTTVQGQLTAVQGASGKVEVM